MPDNLTTMTDRNRLAAWFTICMTILILASVIGYIFSNYPVADSGVIAFYIIFIPYTIGHFL